MSEEIIEVQDGKFGKLEIYRTQSAIKLNPWIDKGRVMLELVPSFEGVKGQPQSGEKRFDYDKKISISFTCGELLSASFKFQAIAHGAKEEYKKFADMSKSTHIESNDKKTLSVIPGDKGITISLFQGKDNKVSITLNRDEIYALSKYFELFYQFMLYKALSTPSTGSKNV